jgi:hypothetical protein
MGEAISTVVFWDHTAGEQQNPVQVASNFMVWLAERVERELENDGEAEVQGA